MGGTAFVDRVIFMCSIPVTYVFGMTGFNTGACPLWWCCFISTRSCILLDRKFLWMVVGSATGELSPQYVRNEGPSTLHDNDHTAYLQEH